jgi:hypothetical protein
MTKTKIRDDDDDVFDSNGILKDGKHVTVSMFMKDGLPNPDLTPAQRVAAAVAATRDAMQTFDSNLHRPGFRRAATGTADSVAAATARDAAYADYNRRQSDAWRGTTDDKAPPAGSYPATDYDEGDSCTIGGQAGTLQPIDGYDGFLECVADDDDGGTDDSRTIDAKAKAYESYDSEITNAWRRQK